MELAQFTISDQLRVLQTKLHGDACSCLGNYNENKDHCDYFKGACKDFVGT